MLTKEQKTQWISDLRSGEYKQGVCTLYNSGNNSYCCLGVLVYISDSSISDEAKAIVKGISDGSRSKSDVPNANSPSDAASRVIYQSINDLIGKENVYTLVEMNDSHRSSFNEIADYIEERL